MGMFWIRLDPSTRPDVIIINNSVTHVHAMYQLGSPTTVPPAYPRDECHQSNDQVRGLSAIQKLADNFRIARDPEARACCTNDRICLFRFEFRRVVHNHIYGSILSLRGIGDYEESLPILSWDIVTSRQKTGTISTNSAGALAGEKRPCASSRKYIPRS